MAPNLTAKNLSLNCMQRFDEFLETLNIYLKRSMPRSLWIESNLGQLNRFQTASLPMATPNSLAPISAPHNQAGLLRTTSNVCSTWGISMYVHYIRMDNYKICWFSNSGSELSFVNLVFARDNVNLLRPWDDQKMHSTFVSTFK